MREKIIKVLKSYKFDFDETDSEFQFSVDFDTGMGVMKIIPNMDSVRFELKLDASLDILNAEYREKVIAGFNMGLVFGSFTTSEVTFNPLYVYKVNNENLDEIKIAKIIDEITDTCDMFLKLFQMILCGKSLEEAISEIGFKTIGNG